jgi:tetratricopeptide (TPR) repeat protein
MPRKLSFLYFLSCFALSAFGQDEPTQWGKWETDADTLMSHEDFAGAAVLYSKIIKEYQFKEKSDYRFIYKRAVSYYSGNKFDSALADMNRYVPEFPENPQAWILRALIYRHKGDADNQLNDLQKAIDLRGGNAELFRWRGALRIDKGDFQGAKKDFKEAILLHDDAELETNLGYIYYSLGSLDSALICINKAIVLDVTYAPPYLYAGSFCLQEEKFELALNYLNLALRIEPANRVALFYKGVSLVELNKTDEGCRCLQKAFDAGEDDAVGYLKQYCFDVFK